MSFRDAALRMAVVSIALFAAVSCSTTQPEVEDAMIAEEPPAPPPPTDPRVSELQVLVTELLDRIEVLNARLARLEGGPPPPASQTVSSATPASTTSTDRTTKPAAKAPVVVPANIPDRYREALTLFGKGRIDDSRAMFLQIYAADPSGELADNALYWIGETYYVAGKYNDAMKYYQRISNDYADQNKAPDAMLKIGLTFAKLGDLILAKKAFNDLIAKHPYSIPAATAKSELDRIKY